jgi:putative transposase
MTEWLEEVRIYMGSSGKLAMQFLADVPRCKFCGSTDVVKNGKRNAVQYYLCKNCGRGSVYNKGLPKMRYSIDVVADGVYDYYAGVSLPKIREGIYQKAGLRPSNSAIYGWVKRLTKIGLTEAKKHTPQVGDKWLADECVLKLKDGKKYWLINVIDYDTRFLLASRLSSSRGIKDICLTFKTAKDEAKISPKLMLTDGWQAYIDGTELVFGANTKHIKTTPFERKELSTNIVERWHGTLKDRLKPMRGMDKSETQQLILEGFILNYNYLRPHESLNDRTPAEVAKIHDFPYASWLDVIKSQIPKPPPLPKLDRTLTIEELRHLPIKPYRKRPKPKAKRKHATKPEIHRTVTTARLR